MNDIMKLYNGKIMNYKRRRNSNIEFLKIVAMCAIVTCHVTAELANSTYIHFDDYVVKYYLPSQSFENVILTIIHQLGFLGNTLFFICSSWFLVDSNKTDYRKIVSILMDIEILSILFLIAYFLFTQGEPNLKLGVKMLFPHSFRLFWYLTCYILVYILHPVLNSVILSMSKRELLSVSIFSGFLFIVYNYFIHWYFGSVLISWVVLYFQVAYIKLYLLSFQHNMMANYICCIIGLIGILIIPFGINLIGSNIAQLRYISMQYFDDIQRWNPFHILLCFGIFNLTNLKKPRYIELINYISSLSLLCFIIHSNRFVRCYIIPYIWEFLWINGWFSHLIITTLLFGFLLFVISLILGCIYSITIKRNYDKYLVPKIYSMGRILLGRLIDKLMMFN